MRADIEEAKMAKVAWKHGGRAADEAIRAVETTLSIDFPEDFIAVIRQHDGGRPQPKAVDIPGRREVVFERLLSVSGSTPETVLEAAVALRKRHEGRLVPFARDPFGNLFCFEYQGRTPVGVVFWDHESGASSPVCGSFTELLALLHQPA